MSGIRGKNTKPELVIRSALHGLGFRFRLHRKDLPGRPDIVLPRYQAVIQINGCFWHGHMCALFKWPNTREEFWKTKIHGNMERDKRNLALLAENNWRICVIWECALRSKSSEQVANLLSDLEAWIKGPAEYAEFSGSFPTRSQ
ncbi:very short patch repair endonuclease [Marinobacter lipolyticus]